MTIFFDTEEISQRIISQIDSYTHNIQPTAANGYPTSTTDLINITNDPTETYINQVAASYILLMHDCKENQTTSPFQKHPDHNNTLTGRNDINYFHGHLQGLTLSEVKLYFKYDKPIDEAKGAELAQEMVLNNYKFIKQLFNVMMPGQNDLKYLISVNNYRQLDVEVRILLVKIVADLLKAGPRYFNYPSNRRD